MTQRRVYKTSAKSDAPPLTVKVDERGHMVGLTPYDQERIFSYSNRPYVEVYIAAPMRPKERKWNKIVGLVVKECETPWASLDVARDAIKFALDHVRLVEVDGKIKKEAESLSVMSDAEFELFYESSMALLTVMFKVDPESLWKSSPYYVGDEMSAGSSHVPNPVEQGDGAVAPQAEPSPAETPARGGPTADERTGASQASAAYGREDRAKMIECAKKFMGAATDAACTPVERKMTLEGARKNWQGEAPAEFVQICYERGLDVVSGRMSSLDAKRILEALIP